MDNRCPCCGEDLLRAGITQQLSKSQKLISHWIDKMPMECNNCHSHLEKNEHKIETNFRFLPALFYAVFVFLMCRKILIESYILWAVVAMIITLSITKMAINHKLKTWPRYKRFEVQTHGEKIAGYIVTFIFYLMFIGFPLALILAILFMKK